MFSVQRVRSSSFLSSIDCLVGFGGGFLFEGGSYRSCSHSSSTLTYGHITVTDV